VLIAGENLVFPNYTTSPVIFFFSFIIFFLLPTLVLLLLINLIDSYSFLERLRHGFSFLSLLPPPAYTFLHPDVPLNKRQGHSKSLTSDSDKFIVLLTRNVSEKYLTYIHPLLC
jgi:hypothetical protein